MDNGYKLIVSVLLIAKFVDLNYKDSVGYTLLIIAARNGYKTIVKLLLRLNKVKPDPKEFFRRTLLLYAI